MVKPLEISQSYIASCCLYCWTYTTDFVAAVCKGAKESTSCEPKINMFLVRSSLLSALSIVLLSLSSAAGHEDLTPEDCELPPINFESQRIDVLGDHEKRQVCRLPRPQSLCPRVGAADSACRAIARAVGGVRNVSCSHPHTCAFLVKAPTQHPHTPGFAYVTLCTPKFIGVIFPCRENNLVIANPFWRGVYVDDNPPPDVDPGEEEPGNIASNPHCEFPRLNVDAITVDVLGDREKANICTLPRPAYLCERGKGPADEFCKKIARAAGGTSDASCFRRRTCAFHVKRPVQHPNEPGEAYVSLCVPDFAGVIFPCRENNLVVIDPFFNSIEVDEGDEPMEDAPNWGIESSSNNTAKPTPPRPHRRKTTQSASPHPEEKGCQLFGKYIANKLNNMDPIQARIAERLISEVLFEGVMGSLNRYVKMVDMSSYPTALPLQPNVDQTNSHQHPLVSEDDFPPGITMNASNTTHT